MDEHLLLMIMAGFVVIAAIALVIQACLLFGIYKASRGVGQSVERLTPKVEALMPKVDALIPKVQALMESSKTAVDESRTQILAVTTRANEVLDSARKQMARVDDVLSDAATRTRRQMDHAELVLDDALNRAQKTITTVQGGVMKPIREMNAVAAGLRAGIHFLMRSGRPSPDQVTVDEEMFI